MFATEVRDEIKSVLGNPSNKDTLIQNSIIRTVEGKLEKRAFLPWFLISEFNSANATVGEERLQVPTDFLREVEEEGTLWIVEDDGELTQLHKEGSQGVRAAKYYTGSGKPVVYGLVNDYFRLFPTPDDTYEFKLTYYKEDAAITFSPDIETAWLKHAPYLVMAHAGLRVAKQSRDPNAITIFKDMLQEAESELVSMDAARRNVNRDVSMGEEL